MEGKTWYIIDTETNGFRPPIYIVEIGAQRMVGWEPSGKPFRMLINHGCKIPPEASRVHGYTRAILEKKGKAPELVYERFREYVGGSHPIVAYNLSFDWNRALVPEWERLGISPIGERGFCALRLAQRLLDPCPAGNCQLQTLRQYYNLKGGQAHTALGDVNTTIDLLRKVLKEKAQSKDLNTWDELERYAEKKHYPTILPFGKYAGRDFREAKDDPEFLDWLKWLATRSERQKTMGAWYLRKLGVRVPKRHRSGNLPEPSLGEPPDPAPTNKGSIDGSVRQSKKTSRRRRQEPLKYRARLRAVRFILFGIVVPIGVATAALIIFFAKLAVENRNSLMRQESAGAEAGNSKLLEEAKKQTKEHFRIVALPSDLRIWTFVDGRKEIMRAIDVDLLNGEVVFRHPTGRVDSENRITMLVDEDQQFLLGRLFNQSSESEEAD